MISVKNMPIPLKAVIFDYGNVVSEPQGAEQIEGMATVLGLPREDFEKHYWALRVAYDEAQFEPTEYWDQVARLAGRTVSPSQIDELNDLDARSWMHPRMAISAWERALRQSGLRTALLSNMPVTLRDALRDCPWLPDFHWRTLSCDVRIAKPAREIYLHCLSGLGLAPADVLFLDDREPNVRAAQDLGMYALQFRTMNDLALEIQIGFDLPAPV